MTNGHHHHQRHHHNNDNIIPSIGALMTEAATLEQPPPPQAVDNTGSDFTVSRTGSRSPVEIFQSINNSTGVNGVNGGKRNRNGNGTDTTGNGGGGVVTAATGGFPTEIPTEKVSSFGEDARALRVLNRAFSA